MLLHFCLIKKGVVSGAVIFLREDMMLSDLQIEIAVASTILSAAVSAWFGEHLLESLGRKRTLVVASSIFAVGSLIMAASFGSYHNGYIMLVLGRIIVGAAIGFASEAGPLYISECAPPDMRGSLTTLFNVAVVGGQVFASILCGLLSSFPSSYNWRLMLAFGAVPALAQMIGFLTLPFSPAWLVLRGRADEAEQVLYQIRSLPVSDDLASKDHLDPVQEELNEIMRENEIAKQNQHVSLLNLWKTKPAIRRAMILGCTLWATSQLAGINTIMYYGASIVRKTGLEGGRSFDIWITVPLNTMQLLGIFVCYCMIDRAGRRHTLLLSMTMVWISLLCIGVGFTVDWGVVTILAMCCYLFGFGVGLSTMPYALNAEIYPTEYRGVCVAQSTAVFWFSNFVVSLTFLTLARTMGNGGVFFFYAVIVMVSEVYFYFTMPETNGKSLQEIQANFADQCLPASEEYPLSDGDDSPKKSSYGSNTAQKDMPSLESQEVREIV